MPSAAKRKRPIDYDYNGSPIWDIDFESTSSYADTQIPLLSFLEGESSLSAAMPSSGIMSDHTVHEVQETPNERKFVLYRLRAREGERDDRYFYQTSFIKGLDTQGAGSGLRSGALPPLLYMIDADVKDGTNKIVYQWTFRRGEDAPLLARRWPAIELHSPALLSVFSDIIDHYPELAIKGFKFYPAKDHRCCPTLKLLYRNLKAYHKGYLSTLGAAEVPNNDVSREEVEDIGDAGDEELVPFDSVFDGGYESSHYCDLETASEVAQFLKVFAPAFKHEIAPKFQKLASSKPVVYYDDLWLVFWPGSDVFVSAEADFLGHVVVSVSSIRVRPGAEKHIDRTDRTLIEVWRLVFNGLRIKRRSSIIAIDRFEGERSVFDLPVFPRSLEDAVHGIKNSD
ncbi:uncharacterized protein KY384_007808 [Bacidia gigantensis]|uniref:uncharacterized protein n=1 Tax=Bacidia gigantensis TaxID=2732470 RepID=UPI001D052CBE|nr:uncharacterized protein KY384_007808 [Bacidia gigantensis]KAG8527655.1 hypothetical protein KY384_007808 [Bacidia gigantensis]